jgi:hypothetical protein
MNALRETYFRRLGKRGIRIVEELSTAASSWRGFAGVVVRPYWGILSGGFTVGTGKEGRAVGQLKPNELAALDVTALRVRVSADERVPGRPPGVNYQRDGLVTTSGPSTVWCRADLTPRQAPRMVAHEVRHAWQFTRRSWDKPTPDHSDDAESFRIRFEEWLVRRNRYADAYANSQGPLVEAAAS